MEEFNTHLTIHLYRKDEVVSAFRFCILNRNSIETIYWGLELFDSDMQEDAIKMLEFIWITEIGFGSFSFLRRILDIYKSGEIDRDTWIYLLYSLSRVTARDSSILYLLIRGAITPPEYIPRFPHNISYNTPQDAIENTLSRGKTLCAWLFSRAITSEEQWSILKVQAKAKHRDYPLKILQSSKLSDIEKRAVAFILVSYPQEKWLCSLEEIYPRELPSEIKTAIDEWDSEESLRKRRVYSIRPESLLYLTARSTQSPYESSEKDIKENLLDSLLDSPYWKDILDNYMVNGTWKSDAYHEMFYNTYFLDDIPDEWSLVDREKSHGRGLGRSYSSGFNRFIQTMFQRSKTLGIWNSDRLDVNTLNCITQYENWTTVYDDMHKKCITQIPTQYPLHPIKKTFEILSSRM